MSRYISEDRPEKRAAANEFGTRQLFRRPAPVAATIAVYEIKVFEDDEELEVREEAFVWQIPEDLDQSEIIKVEAFITTSGSGATTINIRAGDPCTAGTDILTTPITIDSGDCNSKDAATQPVISGDVWEVAWGDHLHIDVDAFGTGAMGLGVIVTLTPSPLGSVTLQGAQGPQGEPGGIIAWMGEWDSGTAYVENDAVSHNGSSYVAVQGSTNVEPGVDANWEDYWMLLAEGASATGVAQDVTQTGHGLSVGDVVIFDGTDYVAAQADSAANAEVVGIVSVVADADNFTLQMGGHVTGLTGLTAGMVYFLSESTPGALTATEPTAAGEISKPLLIADSTTSGYFFNFRGLVIGDAGGSGVDFGLVTALPGSPSDGDYCTLTDSLSAGTYQWRFQYVSARSTNKWVFIGGPPLEAEVATAESTSSTSFTDLATTGPAVTLPVAGDYFVDHGTYMDGSAGGVGGAMSYAIGATAASDNDSVSLCVDNNAVNRLNGRRLKKKTGLTAVTLTCKYKNTDVAGSPRFISRYIAVTPIALGG